MLWLLDKLVMPMTRGQSSRPVHGHAAAAAAASGTTATGGNGEVEGFPSEKAFDEEGMHGGKEGNDFFTIFIGDDRTDEVMIGIRFSCCYSGDLRAR